MLSASFRIIDRTSALNPRPTDIFWFCHAGGGSAPLVRALAQTPTAELSDFRLNACVLPGREDRFSQPRIHSMPELIESLTKSMQENFAIKSGAPKVIIGHSLGALIAYRLSQKLTLLGTPPSVLVVMAMNSPDRFRSRADRLRLGDEDLADELDREFGGIPDVIRKNPAAMQLFLPILRSDLQLMETFADLRFGNELLKCPVVAIHGTNDPAATEMSMQGWSNVTNDSFSVHRIDGDHFFPIKSIAQILRIAQDLIP